MESLDVVHQPPHLRAIDHAALRSEGVEQFLEDRSRWQLPGVDRIGKSFDAPAEGVEPCRLDLSRRAPRRVNRNRVNGAPRSRPLNGESALARRVLPARPDLAHQFPYSVVELGQLPSRNAAIRPWQCVHVTSQFLDLAR